MHRPAFVWHHHGASRPTATILHQPESFSAGEIFRGVAELVISAAVIVLPILFPHLLALPLMALGGFIVIGLAVWDDHARAH